MAEAHITFHDSVDPEALPSISRTTHRLAMRVFNRSCMEPSDRHEYAAAIPAVLKNPMAVFELVATVAGKTELQGWVFVGQPTHYLVNDPNDPERRITKTFPANRQMVVKVDLDRWVFNWFKCAPITDDEGVVIRPVTGCGACLYPLPVLG